MRLTGSSSDATGCGRPVRCRDGAAARRPPEPPTGTRGDLVALVLLTLLFLSPPLVAGQLRSHQVGTVDTGLLLRTLDGEKRVLMIGAHPDDEDTSLLAALARGEGAQAAYLSLSRGEGGQNLIGPELSEGLGIVRTGELLSARRVDGADQYFTRAFDFGFSKSAEETFGHWPREELLRDVVWVVRSFRPHVILSVFQGTPSDGHGQHQAAGIMAREAFEVAGDPSRFPGQLELGVEAWEPSKLYRLVRWDPSAASLHVETGRLDPLLGRSHFQVAMESRSRHRSQDMGTEERPGPRSSGAALVASRVSEPAGGEDGFFSGVDTALVRIAGAAEAPAEPALLETVRRYREAITEARRSLAAESPGEIAPLLLDARVELERARGLAGDAPEGPERIELLRVLDRRSEGVTEALLSAGRVVVDVRIERQRLVPGEEVELEVLVWNGGELDLEVEGIDIGTPAGWGVRQGGTAEDYGPSGPSGSFDGGNGAPGPGPTIPTPVEPDAVEPGELRSWTYRIVVPEDAEPSRLYYMSEPRVGSLYRWPENPDVWAKPKNPALLYGRVAFRVAGDRVGSVEREGIHVGVDKARGEYRVPVLVVPALSVDVDPEGMAWPAEDREPRRVTVRVRNHAGEPAEAEVGLQVPRGWRVRPTREAVSVPPGGGEGTAIFELAPTAATQRPERGIFRASAEFQGREYGESWTIVDYPHLDPAPLTGPSELRVSEFPVRVTEGLRVGYIMGSGDAGARALRDLGVDVTLLTPEAFASAELDAFDTIVLGIRTYETRPDVAAANPRLLEFARNGGTLVVQYNKYEYPEGGFAPYPVEMARPHDRVTDPDAPVTLLAPSHPALRRPNRLTPEDFEDWVQERGLYFLRSWDGPYTPLLEMSDAGEAPNRGALVVAPLGDGAYVYTGLSLFRQLPAGVPGAFRLLANLVSLRGSDLSAGQRGEEVEVREGEARLDRVGATPLVGGPGAATGTRRAGEP